MTSSSPSRLYFLLIIKSLISSFELLVRRIPVAVHSAKINAPEEFCFAKHSLINYGIYAGIALLVYSVLLLLLAFGIYKCVSCCSRDKNANDEVENDRTNINGI